MDRRIESVSVAVVPLQLGYDTKAASFSRQNWHEKNENALSSAFKFSELNAFRASVLLKEQMLCQFAAPSHMNQWQMHRSSNPERIHALRLLKGSKLIRYLEGFFKFFGEFTPHPIQPLHLGTGWRVDPCNFASNSKACDHCPQISQA